MFKNATLRTRLLSLMGSVILVSLSMFAIMAYFELGSIRKSKEALAKNLSESFIDKIDRNLFERYGDVQAFALSEPARSGNPTRIMAFMNDMMTTYAPIYDVMMVTNAAGRVIAINGVDKAGKPLNITSLLGHDFSTAIWFREAINGKVQPGSAFVEDAQIDSEVSKALGSNLYHMNFTSPIRDKDTGEILGVWTNRMSWIDVVEAITNEELKKVREGDQADVYAFIMDKGGRYIVHPDTTKVHNASFPKIDKISDALKKSTLVSSLNVSENYFKGKAYEAVTLSRGYAVYPGKGWMAAVQVSAADKSLDYTWMFIGLACILFAVVMSVGWMTIQSISRSLSKIVSGLSLESASVQSAATQISTGAKNLADASTVQASAIQETASAVEETNAMVKKSADNALRSRDVSSQSHDAASRGKEAVEEMIRAIGDINTSNESIMRQIDDSNGQISEIVKLITEIGNKTKVINDIVFQTKLLSFNASVEAARAGEHGKGFAVVAEEVGNLAQMSGNAAKEISDMLSGSIARVESIVTNTKSQVERLISDGKTKVQSGTIVAKQCGEILEEVVRNVSEVNEMIGEISTAAQEQSVGVAEITKAINQLDEATHNNAATSQESSKAAAQLTHQSQKLLSIVEDLDSLIRGKSASNKRVEEVVQSLNKATKDYTAKAQAEWKGFADKKKPTASANPVPGKKLNSFKGNRGEF